MIERDDQHIGQLRNCRRATARVLGYVEHAQRLVAVAEHGMNHRVCSCVARPGAGLTDARTCSACRAMDRIERASWLLRDAVRLLEEAELSRVGGEVLAMRNARASDGPPGL